MGRSDAAASARETLFVGIVNFFEWQARSASRLENLRRTLRKLKEPRELNK